MGELEIVREVNGLGDRDVAVHLEVHHLDGVTVRDGTTDSFREDVHGDLNTGDRGDETDRDYEDDRHDDTEDDDGGAGVCRVDADTDHAQHGGDCEDEEVPPLRNLVVRLHELEVDVLGEVVVGFGLADPLLDTAVESLEAEGNVVAVVQERVGDGWDISNVPV